MSVIICPSITAYNAHDYRAQLTRVLPFAPRVHIDLMDGKLASPESLNIESVRWPDGLQVDLHVMYQEPYRYAALLMKLRPSLVIVHAEADGDFSQLAAGLHHVGIRVGVALLPITPVAEIAPALSTIDHVLVYSGNLGHTEDSVADLRLLSKVRQLRALKPELEIGWDGGLNSKNAAEIVQAGVDVLNIGGPIQHATDPAHAYATLESIT